MNHQPYNQNQPTLKLDILTFAVHPDDAELSCGGTLLIEKLNGKKTGLIDLTQGELGTRGTIETRANEATEASKILQLDIRENLMMADGFFENNEENKRKVITMIRKYRPEIVLAGALDDRHPDHGRSAQLVSESAFLAGLRKIETNLNGIAQEAWRPKYVFHYIQDRYMQPDFVIDISTVIDQKIEAIKAFKTQFNATDNSEPQTYISTPAFLESIIYRSKMMGKMIGVAHAEGFISKKMIGFNNFSSFICMDT